MFSVKHIVQVLESYARFLQCTFSDDTVYGEVKIVREQKYRKWASSAVNLKRIWPRRASKARAVHAVGVGGGAFFLGGGRGI